MNLTTAPAVPALLSSLQLLTFFVTPELGILNRENGHDWHLRAYQSLGGLAPIPVPPDAPKVKKGISSAVGRSAKIIPTTTIRKW